MTYSKFFLASLLGALSFSSSALASRGRVLSEDDHAPEVHTSRAKCEAVAIGYSEVQNTEAIASATASAAAYICNGETDKSAHSIATATAESFALAVASASVACELEGDAHVQVDAHASAVAQANIWLTAYASAWAGAGDCDKCEAYAESFGYVREKIFLKAVADAEIKLKAYTSGSGPLIFKVLDFQSTLKTAVVTAFAEALAAAADLKNTLGCAAWTNAGGCIYIPEHPDTTLPDCDAQDNVADFECTAIAVSVGAIEEISAMSDAVAHAAAWTCGDAVAIADLEVTAKSLAKATAIAISYAYAECEVNGGWACAIAYTEIEQTARAVAKTYAELWAGAYTCPGHLTCAVSIDAVAEAVGKILVKAATDAFEAVCIDGTGHWTVEDLAVDIESASLCALAEASAIAISIAPSTCLAGGIVYADASLGHCPAH